MIYFKTDEEVEIIRQNCLLVCKTLALAASMLKPGVFSADVDERAEEFIRDHGAVPGFKGYNDFPATLCVSRNSAVVHGVPDNKAFEDGEIVSIDCGVYWNDFYGDAAYTFAIGDVEEAVMDLLRVTNESLYLAIDNAIVGKRLGDIGSAIQRNIIKNGYSIVRDLVGHGLGKNLHEEPQVPNFGKRGRGPKLKDGLVIAIEPMINMGKKDVVGGQDGHTIYTKDGKPSAHFEHTVVVRRDKADILSDHSFIEKAVLKNSNLKEVAMAEAV